jgi:hypothetical protein
VLVLLKNGRLETWVQADAHPRSFPAIEAQALADAGHFLRQALGVPSSQRLVPWADMPDDAAVDRLKTHRAGEPPRISEVQL